MAKLVLRSDPDMLGYVGGASLECGKDAHHHGNGALQEERDVITG
jgi:hypothetical protein